MQPMLNMLGTLFKPHLLRSALPYLLQVKTLDGKMVWRRRHYRVKRGATPGTFHLSVLDNGVTSKEYWRILDCAEDLEW